MPRNGILIPWPKLPLLGSCRPPPLPNPTACHFSVCSFGSRNDSKTFCCRLEFYI